MAILGVPFDSGVSYRPGARFGPAAIRAGSKLLRPYHAPLEVEPWYVHQVADAGDLAPNPFDIGEAIAQIEAGATTTLERADRLLALGGDHTIALPLLRVAKRDRGPIALVHFDAHLDTWDTYFGAAYTHGTPFRRAFEEGLLASERSVHVGIRGSLYGTTDLADDAGFGFEIVSTADVARAGVDAAIERIRGRVGDSPVYISIDIDVLDPAHAPGHRHARARRALDARGDADPARAGGAADRGRGRGRGRAAVRPRRADRAGSGESRLRVPRAVRARRLTPGLIRPSARPRGSAASGRAAGDRRSRRAGRPR